MQKISTVCILDTCMHECMYAYMHNYTNVCMYILVRTCIPTPTHIQTHKVDIHKCLAYVSFIHSRIRSFIHTQHTHTHTPVEFSLILVILNLNRLAQVIQLLAPLFTRVFQCLHTNTHMQCMHACMHKNTHMHILCQFIHV